MNPFIRGGQAAGLFFSAGAPSRNTFGPATSAQEVVGLLKNSSPGNSKMEEVQGLLGRSLRIDPRALPLANLGGPDVFLQRPITTLDFAIFLRACRRPHSDSLPRDSRTGAWRRVAQQIREGIADFTWKHVELMGKLGTAFSEALRRVGRRLSAVHFTSAAPSGIFELREILCNRRFAPHNWDRGLSRRPPLVSDGRSNLCWEVVVARRARSHSRAS